MSTGLSTNHAPSAARRRSVDQAATARHGLNLAAPDDLDRAVRQQLMDLTRDYKLENLAVVFRRPAPPNHARVLGLTSGPQRETADAILAAEFQVIQPLLTHSSAWLFLTVSPTTSHRQDAWWPIFELGELAGALYLRDGRWLVDRGVDLTALTNLAQHAVLALRSRARDHLLGGCPAASGAENLPPCETAAQLTKLQTAYAERVAASRQAFAANRATSGYIAHVSHEIRTPMTAILGFSELLEEHLAGDELARQHLSTIQSNGAHLLQLVNGLLDIARIEAGKFELDFVPCDPRALADEVLETVAPEAQRKGLILATRQTPSLHGQTLSDPFRIRQILLNLLANAIKFTPAGRVDLKLVQTVKHGQAWFEFHVRDTGPGLTSEQQRTVFQPFRQFADHSTERFGGVGLGLVIARQLARALGGDLTVRSRPGHGAFFTLRIPFNEVDRATSPDAPPTSATVPFPLTGRVLLAEDADDTRRLLHTILHKAGLSVTSVEDGLQACDAFAAAGQRFDVILLDLQMPVMDGFAAAARLRAAGCDSPVFALTAHAMAEQRTQALSAGFDDFVTKPIRRNDLLAVVARALRRQ